MASGGMGDVLSGMLGALAGQHDRLEWSAWLGVMVHGLAGDAAAMKAPDSAVTVSVRCVLSHSACVIFSSSRRAWDCVFWALARS